MATQIYSLHSLFTSVPLTFKTSRLSNPLLKLKPNTLIVAGKSDPRISGRKLRAAVIGGGPAGSSAAETFAAGGIETFLFERSPGGAKPCGGAIPLCMLDEFSIPPELIDRKVTHEFISMLRREVLDSYLRSRAESKAATTHGHRVLPWQLAITGNHPLLHHHSSAIYNSAGLSHLRYSYLLCGLLCQSILNLSSPFELERDHFLIFKLTKTTPKAKQSKIYIYFATRAVGKSEHFLDVHKL